MFIVLKKNNKNIVHAKCTEDKLYKYDTRLFNIYTEAQYEVLMKRTPLFTLKVIDTDNKNKKLVYRGFYSLLELKDYILTSSMHMKLIGEYL